VVAHLVQRQVATGAFERNFVIVLVVVFSASVGIAAVSYYLLERPAMALARRVHAEGRANVPTRRVLPDTASAPRDDAYDDFPAGRSEAPAAVRVSSAPT
jgi:peptidoglycan/LPS O-acetylase OafA/YrhL